MQKVLVFVLAGTALAATVNCSQGDGGDTEEENLEADDSSCSDVLVDIDGKPTSVGYLPADPKLAGNDAARKGRCMWTHYAPTAPFFRKSAILTKGAVDVVKIIDNQFLSREKRFEELGLINDPDCKEPSGTDEYGMRADVCPKDPGASGVVGVRKFKNPAFKEVQNGKRFSWDAYQKDVELEPPYIYGVTCAICHATFDPEKPPVDVNHPKWSEINLLLGNMYLKEGPFFGMGLHDGDFNKEVLYAQTPGTSDTSRIPNDHINAETKIDAIVGVKARLMRVHSELQVDGTKADVPMILKDGADSVGVSLAVQRVYVNIGACDDQWMQHHDAIFGNAPQTPITLKQLKSECASWNEFAKKNEDGHSYVEDQIAFFLAQKPWHLENAPEGAYWLSHDTDGKEYSDATIRRGAEVFADNCASCHSSKLPSDGKSFRDLVAEPSFIDDNYFSDDARHSVIEIGTNVQRAVGTNAMRGHIWDNFSSETYKRLPSPGSIEVVNPLTGDKRTFKIPEGGPGYLRTPSLVSAWATAPFLQNNSVGTYTGDPSVEGRVKVYEESMRKLLLAKGETRGKMVKLTQKDSTLDLTQNGGFFDMALDFARITKLNIPAGTPMNLFANLDSRRSDVKKIVGIVKAESLVRDNADAIKHHANSLMDVSGAPDLVEDRGHLFGTTLTDEEKLALIQYMKRF